MQLIILTGWESGLVTICIYSTLHLLMARLDSAFSLDEGVNEFLGNVVAVL